MAGRPGNKTDYVGIHVICILLYTCMHLYTVFTKLAKNAVMHWKSFREIPLSLHNIVM